MKAWGEKERIFNLLHKAIELAPRIAYPHDILGDTYSDAACPYWNLNPIIKNDYYQKSIKEYQTSLKLNSSDSHAAWMLLMIYKFWLPDKEKAKQAKALYLSLVPPNHKFSKQTQGVLDSIK
jgi:hypothetical protein